MEILLIIVVIILGYFFLLKPVEKIAIKKEIESYASSLSDKSIEFRSNFMFKSYKIFAENNGSITRNKSTGIDFNYILNNGKKIKITVVDENWLGHEDAKVCISEI